MFVVLVLLHFSVRISALERRMTALVQELGILSLGEGRTTENPPADRPRKDEIPVA
jgi:hypothetical protein